MWERMLCGVYKPSRITSADPQVLQQGRRDHHLCNSSGPGTGPGGDRRPDTGPQLTTRPGLPRTGCLTRSCPPAAVRLNTEVAHFNRGVAVKVTGELQGRGSIGIYLEKLRRGGCVGQTRSACESGPGGERRESSAAGRAFKKPRVAVLSVGRGCSGCGLRRMPWSGAHTCFRTGGPAQGPQA